MIKVIKGDITELSVDAVVNAANNHLWMGAGVAGAIKRKGGAVIEKEAVAKGPIPVGEAVVTGAGALKARYVIHAAAMGQDLVTDAPRVRAATRNALLRAEELGLYSIAFPALGTGVGGLDFDVAARVMVSEARRHLARGSALEEVVFALFDDAGFSAFSRIAGRKRVVCLGDSITYGFPYGPETSWAGICARELELDMVNRGVNGDTTGQMRRRFASDVVSLSPAYVIILGGTNDAWMGVAPAEVQENVRAMVSEAFEAGICPVLGLPAPANAFRLGGFPPEDVAEYTADLDSCRDWLREFAGEQLLPVLDFNTPLLDPRTGKADPAYFVDDGHPNTGGYRVLAKAAEQVLLKVKKDI
ncbi:MAG: macro domain-containing protein [Peptococcaceae bacterium]|nr:macro domain-containing protein [Peptococcaceae bacterium]